MDRDVRDCPTSQLNMGVGNNSHEVATDEGEVNGEGYQYL